MLSFLTGQPKKPQRKEDTQSKALQRMRREKCRYLEGMEQQVRAQAPRITFVLQMSKGRFFSFPPSKSHNAKKKDNSI